MLKISGLKKKFISTILISSSLFLFIILFSTGEIYFNNFGEFNYSYSEIFLYLIAIFFLFVFLVTSILLITPNRLFKIISSVFLSLILLSWIEGYVLYPDYGPLDGRIIDWDSWLTWGYIDILIWIIVLIIFGYLNVYIIKYLNRASLIIISIILVSISFNYIKYSSENLSDYSFDYNPIANFSRKQNIIVILLDEIQSDIFYELLNEHKIINKVFNGFTYYPDTVAGYGFTVPSIPLMFTGQYYDNSQPFSEYVNRSYSERSITKHLIDNNYRVDLFPKFLDLNYLKSKKIAHNIIRRGELFDFDQGIQQSSNLINLALFKISPHIFRKHIYNNYIFFLSNNKKKKRTTSRHIDYWYQDIDFVRKIEAKSKVVYKKPAFKFFHLRGAHVPWIYDANGDIVEENELTGSRKNYKDHLLHTLKLTSDILKKFHEIGIYDSSLIYILSDHGTGRSYGTRVNLDTRYKNIDNTENSTIPYIIKARAIPLFMKKKPYSKGELKISNNPISTSEFPQILIKDLKLDSYNYKYTPRGKNLRRFFYYNTIFAKKGYLPPMFEFYINGDSWLDSSWEGPSKVYTDKGKYDSLFSIEFNKIPKCLNKVDEEIQNDLFIFSYKKETDYILKIKKKIENQILLVVSFKVSEEINNTNIDIFINVNKIKTMKSKTTPNLINKPYQLVYIDEKKINLFDNNTIKLKITGAPKQCLKKTISSLHLFELEK